MQSALPSAPGGTTALHVMPPSAETCSRRKEHGAVMRANARVGLPRILGCKCATNYRLWTIQTITPQQKTRNKCAT